MREYNNSDVKSNEAELDPCIAAEVRMKKGLISPRMRRSLLAALILSIFIAILLVLLFLLLSRKQDVDRTDSNVASAPIVADYEQFEAVVTTEQSISAAETVLPTQRLVQAPKRPTLHKSSSSTKRLGKPVIPVETSTSAEDSTDDEHEKLFTISAAPVVFPWTTDELQQPITTATTQSPDSKRQSENTRQGPSNTVPFSISAAPQTQPVTTTVPTTTVSISTISQSTVPTTTVATTTVSTSEVPTTTVTVPTTTSVIKEEKVVPKSVVPLNEDDDVIKDCKTLLDDGKTTSGVYRLHLDKVGSFDAVCDMDTDGGGWTVMQRREDDTVYFANRTWAEYEQGFGTLSSSFWLGLKKIHALVAKQKGRSLVLRIELNGDFCSDGDRCSQMPDGFWWGEWDFKISDASRNYMLTISPATGGNLTERTNMDKFYYMNNGKQFTAIDKDNDRLQGNCAQFRDFGGWWHNDCGYVALNGRYGDSSSKMRNAFFFYSRGSRPVISYYIKPRRTTMMIRRKN